MTSAAVGAVGAEAAAKAVAEEEADPSAPDGAEWGVELRRGRALTLDTAGKVARYIAPID